MKSFIVLAVFAAVALAAPAPPLTADSQAVIEAQENTNIGLDQYQYGYKTSNGITGQEQAILADAGTENEGLEASGAYSYIGTDGLLYEVTYTAGRAGFQPVAKHIPKAVVA